MKTRVIFASLILGLGILTSKANAATTITDDSPAANKPASTMLVNCSEKHFASYVEHNMGQFTRKGADWQNFMNVVSLYNQSPVAVLTLSAHERSRFNEATSELNKQLTAKVGVEAGQWLNQANHTAQMINFIWTAMPEVPVVPEILVAE